MDPEKIKAAIEALKNGDGASALEVLEAMLIAAAGGGAEPPAPADAGATASAGEQPPAELAALARGVVALFSGKTPGEVLEIVKGLKAGADQVATDSAALEASERRGLVTELVTLGVEFPATAWEDTDAEGDKRLPVERLAKEPIDKLRHRVGLVRTTRGKGAPAAAGATPPPLTGGKLTEADLPDADKARAAEIKDVEKRAKFVELRLARLSKARK